MPTTTLHHLVYHSDVTLPMSEKALEALLSQSREWNTQHSLTGVLLYSGNNIMQVLEGPEDEVFYIFNKISGDMRHRNVIKLADGPIKQRNFSQWSMGFKAVDPTELQHLAGYLNISRPDFLAAQAVVSDESLHSLLSSFALDDVSRL